MLRYAIFVRSSLKSTLIDLKECGEIFDVSWYLIIRQSSKEFDNELQPVIENENEPLSTMKSLRNAIKSNIHADTDDKKSTIILNSDNFSRTRESMSNLVAEVRSFSN
jgi:hypothetical protein